MKQLHVVHAATTLQFPLEKESLSVQTEIITITPLDPSTLHGMATPQGSQEARRNERDALRRILATCRRRPPMAIRTWRRMAFALRKNNTDPIL